MRLWSTTWGASIVFAVSGCAAEDPAREIPPITWSGVQLDYAPRPGAYELCEGTLPYMDRYVGLVADAMGVEVERPLVYVHGLEQDGSPCPQGALGCSFRDAVFADVAPQEHEIVHGVRSFGGFSQLFFEEGTAEAFGDDARLPMRVMSNGDLMEGIEAASDATRLSTQWYPRAGHFVAHLQERYGPEVTQALLRETDWYSRPKQIIEVIEDETGVGWEEIVEEYEKVPECDQARYRYPLYGCDEPEALRAWCDGGESVRITERIACDDPDTVGPRNGEIWKTIAVEIPEDGEYRFYTLLGDGTVASEMRIEECAMGCDKIVAEVPLELVLPYPGVFLRKGRYALRLTWPEGEAAEVSMKIAGAGCE